MVHYKNNIIRYVRTYAQNMYWVLMLWRRRELISLKKKNQKISKICLVWVPTCYYHNMTNLPDLVMTISVPNL